MKKNKKTLYEYPTQCQNEPAKAFIIAPELINLYNHTARCDFSLCRYCDYLCMFQGVPVLGTAVFFYFHRHYIIYGTIYQAH